MGKAKDTTKRITISLETESPEGRAAWDWLVASQEDGKSISQIVAMLIKAAACSGSDNVAATFAATDDATSLRQDSGVLLAEILKAIQEQPAALASALGQALRGMQLHVASPIAGPNGNGQANERVSDDVLEKRKANLLKRNW